MRKIVGLAAKARSGKDTGAAFLMEHPEVASYALANPLKAGCQSLFGLSNSQAWDDTAKEVRLDSWGMSPREFFQRVGTEWMRGNDPLHWLKRADREINNPPPLPRPLTVEEEQDPEAPFILATQEFFGFTDDQVWTSARSVVDEFWGISPDTAIELIKNLAKKDFPNFASQRKLQEIRKPSETTFRPQLNLEGKDVIIIKDIRFENEAKYIRELGGDIWHIIRNNAKKIKKHSSEAGISIKSCDTVIHNNGTIEDYRLEIEKAWNSLKARCMNKKS